MGLSWPWGVLPGFQLCHETKPDLLYPAQGILSPRKPCPGPWSPGWAAEWLHGVCPSSAGGSQGPIGGTLPGPWTEPHWASLLWLFWSLRSFRKPLRLPWSPVLQECTETCTSTDHPHSRQALAPSSGLGDTSTGTPAWALKVRIHVKGTGSAWLCQGQANNRKGHDALGSHTADHHWTACRAERQGGQGSPEAGLGAAGE